MGNKALNNFIQIEKKNSDLFLRFFYFYKDMVIKRSCSYFSSLSKPIKRSFYSSHELKNIYKLSSFYKNDWPRLISSPISEIPKYVSPGFILATLFPLRLQLYKFGLHWQRTFSNWGIFNFVTTRVYFLLMNNYSATFHCI
jgi:hypothetical protein